MKVRTIAREEFLKLLDSGEKFKLVDVLSREHFAGEHIKGAINLPVDEIEKNAAKILSDKSEKIVVYCASFDCLASTNAANKLKDLGYTDVLDYKGGLKDYKETGRLLEGSLHKETRPKQTHVGCYTC